MLTTVFLILLLVVFGKLALFAFKMAWGIAKIFVSVILLPVVLIGMVLYGLLHLALPILLILGIIILIKTA